ncbi:hypothetical protein LPW36_01985 [Jinshanibacter sp. LJY008]|uniref:Uncharacterized protein n=1 Tax=Limnobaculum eriocheiris TaxID=2897391 RepID=A0A9X1MTN3_9GAMM|nr:hypothetical protein [Limnobaculum eriocheiris]MCD1124814.1 hypothetical protein [Limnobaculum eriocheiris]
MPYIYSTLTAPQSYSLYGKGGGDIPVLLSKITVAGGAGVANKHFITPEGSVTNVTVEELKLLRENPVFKRHLQAGFIKVQSDKKETEKAVSDMNKRDGSAPLQDNDFIADGQEPPTTGTGTSNKKGGKKKETEE